MIKFKKIPNKESELLEIQISDTNNPYMYLLAFWARDAESYYCDALGIEHEDTYSELKQSVLSKLSGS